MFQLYGKNYYIWYKFPKFGLLYSKQKTNNGLRKKESNPRKAPENPDCHWKENLETQKNNRTFIGAVLCEKRHTKNILLQSGIREEFSYDHSTQSSGCPSRSENSGELL